RVRPVGDREREPDADRGVGPGDGDVRVRVVLGVGRRHAGPAGDLRVLAGGHDGRDVALLERAEPDHPVGEPRRTQRFHPAIMTRLPPCSAVHRPFARATFWTSLAALAWTQVGYGAFLALLRRARGGPGAVAESPAGELPRVSLIVAAYAEEDVIAAKVANALAL